MSLSEDPRPLVAHVMYRFDVGGLENGVVNLINRLPESAYRHAVIALTEVTEFRRRIAREDVEYFSLLKPPGHIFRLYPRLLALFRRLRPTIVHTRNLAALEACLPAALVGVPVRIHGEHGRDVGDLDGSNRTYQWVRRAYNPFVHEFVALSKDLQRYLVDTVGISPGKVAQIYNGVDTARFVPRPDPSVASGCPFSRPEHWLVGTVGRMQAVKNQTLLTRAFAKMLEMCPSLKSRVRLVVVGDGPLLAEANHVLSAAGVADLAWLPGERSDIPEVLAGLDCFVLPSLAEGISNTILEAMSCGLPVVATAVGGNPELVVAGETGALVPSEDVEALARQLILMATDPQSAVRAGQAGRRLIEQQFSLDAMVSQYGQLYDRLRRERNLH